jgi:hypothetical protein
MLSSGGWENIPDSLVKYALQIPLRQGRALEVLVRLDVLCALQGLVVRHGLHALLPECLERGGVFPEIELRADENDGNVRRVVVDFGVPLSSARKVNRHWPLAIRVRLRRARRRTHCVGHRGLLEVSAARRTRETGLQRTLAFTLSKEGGLTMEKQMRNTSVCGYDRGRSLS